MVFSMFVFWGLVAVAVWLLVRGTATPSSNPPAPPTAEETLRQRYAAGELDEEEFTRRLRVLRGDTLTHT
jgi:putative membrane protein